MDNLQEIKGKLTYYIQENTFNRDTKLSEDTLIFKEGIFDSMGFILLIDFLEEKFKITTQDEDMTEENFESINAITQYILRKQDTENS
jgi:acyl carrier protein